MHGVTDSVDGVYLYNLHPGSILDVETRSRHYALSTWAAMRFASQDIQITAPIQYGLSCLGLWGATAWYTDFWGVECAWNTAG